MEKRLCNICGSTSLVELLQLGKHPLADTFLSPEQYKAAEVYYPLALTECGSCSHVMTSFYIPPTKRYVDNAYSYDSSNSPVAESHFKEFAADIAKVYRETTGASQKVRVLDIGSNVGTLLKYLKEDFNFEALGIEPSANISAIARERGIDTITTLFDESLGQHELIAGNPLNIITSTNVVNHIDDLHGMMKAISAIGAENVMLAFEVPYLVDLIEKVAFDTVYHEHVNYFSLRAMDRLLSDWGFQLSRVERISYMCGSLRVYAVRKLQVAGRGSPEVEAAFEAEKTFFRENPRWREAFREQVLAIKRRILSFVHRVRAEGKKVCCIGAATKGNTLLNYCRIDSDAVPACCDVSRLKVGKRMPGSGILIVHDNDLGSTWDFGIVLPWNLSDYLMEKFRKNGLALVFPIQGNVINKDGKVEALN